jgi:hypothetical protein
MQMRENPEVLKKGPLTDKDLERVQRIGKLVYGK